METQVRRLSYSQIDETMIEEAGGLSGKGALWPSRRRRSTGWGRRPEPGILKKIYAAKGRPSDNPLIVHIADKRDLYRIVREVPEKAKKLMEAFWPGPLTMIFYKNELVPQATTGGLDTVAVRMPSDRIAAAFIRAAGGFVAAPSANVSGRPSTTTAAHVEEDLSGRIEMILDGGQAVIGLESTIVDMSVEPPVILRPGAVTEEMMEAVIGPLEVDKAIIAPDSGVKPKAPGMKYRHYAPRADLAVVEGSTEAVIAAINQLAEEAEAEGKRVGIIATKTRRRTGTPKGLVLSLGARKHEEEIAQHLFEVLRDFDETDVDCIYSEAFDEASIGPAIMNRLLKAAGHKVIQV